MGCAAPNPMHWEDLRNQPLDHVVNRGGVAAAPDGPGYDVTFLERVYRVDPEACLVKELDPDPGRELTEEFQILLIRYLVAPNGGKRTGREISEKDLPGGVTFFQGPHTLWVHPIVKLYGSDAEAFASRGQDLNAERIRHGDCGLRFYPFPEIPVTYVLWQEDEEFPASVSVLFDSSIGKWFELDMVFTLVRVVTQRIASE